jgi:hypothetical protein
MTEEQNPIHLVEREAIALSKLDADCERGYAHLGWLLLQVASLQVWRLHFSTFKDYLKNVATIAKKTVPQLHRYFLTVRDLSDTFSADEMERIGITKAMQLRTAKDYALVLPNAVIEAALDTAVSSTALKKVIATTLKMPEADGDWFDLDAEFYVTAEERALIEDAIRAAEHCEPVTKKTISMSGQRKDIVLKWCMEFLATYGGDSDEARGS